MLQANVDRGIKALVVIGGYLSAISIFAFEILIVMKAEAQLDGVSWWLVFTPLLVFFVIAGFGAVGGAIFWQRESTRDWNRNRDTRRDFYRTFREADLTEADISMI